MWLSIFLPLRRHSGYGSITRDLSDSPSKKLGRTEKEFCWFVLNSVGTFLEEVWLSCFVPLLLISWFEACPESADFDCFEALFDDP